MRILFISHAYPPTVGGVENQNYELSTWLGKIAEVKVIANGRGKKILPLWMPYALIKSLFLMPRYDVIVLGNALLAHIGWILKIIYRKPVVTVVHGLDLTFHNWIYQTFWVGFFIPRMDQLIAVGNETIRVAREKGIGEEKLVFIPNGIDIEKFQGGFARTDLEKFLGEDLQNKHVIMTSGRLARRKGVAWFIRNVMPRLAENVLYIVAGDGPDKENILQAITETHLEKRVKTIGYMGDPVRDMLFYTCDIFVQPNIVIAGDMEGFGISVIEAAYCGIPVIAANLEGLKDAIKHEQDGFLVETQNVDGYVARINALLADETYRKNFGQKARQFVIDNFSWKKISQLYLTDIETLVNKK
ncbi:MAG: glycosyltransferase family 4 protein [Parcubacteria group bacterium]|jgi:glycosyltransferase involved in cell wall biosynthesis